MPYCYLTVSDICVKVYIKMRKVTLCLKAPFSFSSVFVTSSNYYFADEMSV